MFSVLLLLLLLLVVGVVVRCTPVLVYMWNVDADVDVVGSSSCCLSSSVVVEVGIRQFDCV